MAEVTYTHWTPKPVKISRAALEAAERRLQWPVYEVEPEWAAFCQFGPDDIGSVWEELGVIRKRPELDWPQIRAFYVRRLARQWLGCVLHGDSA
jgi:hypothetical protein